MSNQNIFPGAYIENTWSRVDLVKKSPFYAMRLALGARVILAPNGHHDYVSLVFDGVEYILSKTNYRSVKALANLFLTDYLKTKGYAGKGEQLRFMPEVLIDGLEHMLGWAVSMFDIPLDKTRLLWIAPDEGPCGDYRSNKPFLYLAGKKDNFYTERNNFANYSAISWFQAFFMHRSPPAKLLSIYQKIKQGGKVLIFEMDDDLFNLPSWNHNSKHYDKEANDRTRAAIELADLGVGSTQQIVDILKDRVSTGKVMLGPNLVEMRQFGPQLKCDRELCKYDGFQPVANNRAGDVEYRRGSETIARSEIDPAQYNPVTILWAGSNTHDLDLKPLVKPIMSLCKKHGLGVRFVFFGYCPPDFLEAYSDNGNTNVRFQVRGEYRHCIDFVEPVPYGDYISVLRNIDPDIAICPLDSHTFNRSKSNLKVLEMGALGIPCIVTDYGPYKFLDHGVTGLKVAEGNRNGDWYDSIESLIQNKQSRLDLGNNLRRLVENEWSWNEPSPNRECWDAIFTEIKKLSDERVAIVSELIKEEQASNVDGTGIQHEASGS